MHDEFNMSTITLTDYFTTKQTSFPVVNRSLVDMNRVASIILSGGEGKRLHPLTLTRCKPAINFGGKYRLIDIPISNAIHAHCGRISILTQFLSSSLHHHIFQAYMQGGRAAGLIEILTAEQKPSGKAWYLGTADAVRHHLNYLLESPSDYFLILSGDQLYNLNFHDMIVFAQETDADVVIATLPVTAQDATRMGVLCMDDQQFVTDFYEKPQTQTLLKKFRSPDHLLRRMGINALSQRQYMASMGIYLFKRQALVNLLKQDEREDFGKHLIPTQVQKGKIAAFVYDAYWEDIGTIEAFYQANLALTDANAPFSFYDEVRPIFTSRYDLPPAKIFGTHLQQAILCEGSLIEADEVTHSLLGPRTLVHKGCIIRDSYVMGNDYYQSPVKNQGHLPDEPYIGENSLIKRAIIDKNVQIGKEVQLINKKNLQHYDGENIFIREGIIVVPRGAIIPNGFVL